MQPFSRCRRQARAFSLACVGTLCLSITALAAEPEEELSEVAITGTLIPGTPVPASNPLLTIDPADLQLKGFSSIADALQRSSVSTGAVQGPQYTNNFTPALQTFSMFGLSPSYTKFLIDGRPMAEYPALYNGTDAAVSIEGIPSVILERIDILPGGQSSIYGSDAIAGVVNISLKKRMTGTQAELRYGWTQDGGGTERRVGLASGFERGGLDVVAGLQYQRTDPIWGFQRPLTDQFYAQGSSAPVAERDWLVFGLFGQPNGDSYYMQDPAACANVAGQFGGTVGLRSRAARGQYCGTNRSGYFTINNGTQSEQAYLHAGYELSERARLFSDVLLSHNLTLSNHGTAFFGTEGDSTGPYNYFFDPNVTPCVQPDGSDCDFLNLQHVFSPEEAGNFREQNDRTTTNSLRATAGIDGALGAGDWRYSADMTYARNRLTEALHLAFTSAINQFYAGIFGPSLGLDPVFGEQPVYNVDYAQFYRPVTPAEYASFTGYATSYSRTQESIARAQLTNAGLWSLPGGAAGAALALEGGAQGWDYAPDPRYLSGETYLYTSTAGTGHRSRLAATAELRLPLLSKLVLNLSDRYDRYQVSGQSVGKDTYNAGLEFRPVAPLLLRGRYGTSFKMPTLPDEYQGRSGFFQTVTDYYACYSNGYTPADIGDCPQAGQSTFGTTSGNPALKPIRAENWSLGFEWRPIDTLRLSADLLSWNIHDEVVQEDSDQLLRTNAACLLGQLPANSPTCVQAVAQVHRDVTGAITEIETPKVNVASETLRVAQFGLGYDLVTAGAGNWSFDATYSNVLRHRYLKFAGDTEIDLLASPFYSTEFKTKANLSVTWKLRDLAISTYVERYGRTPNYLAQQSVEGYAQPGAGRVGTWTIVNLSARYEVLQGLELSANVNNLFDTMPPTDPTQPGLSNQPYSIFNYNNYGRSFFLGLNYRFDSP